jgi:hypothetical protein
MMALHNKLTINPVSLDLRIEILEEVAESWTEGGDVNFYLNDTKQFLQEIQQIYRDNRHIITKKDFTIIAYLKFKS